MAKAFITAVLLVAWLLTMAQGQEIIPNDGLDDTAAVQALFNRESRAATAQGDTKLPIGTITISDTLTIDKSMGMSVSGSGGVNRSDSEGWDRFRVGTILEWVGPPDKPILVLSGCSGFLMEKINFRGTASHGILLRHGAGSLSLAFRDMSFRGQAVGIQCSTAPTEGTCADITYDNVIFYGGIGLRLAGNASCDHTLIRPQFLRCDVNIDMPSGTDVTVLGGGSYHCGTMIRIENRGKNTRGFDVLSHRFDGQSALSGMRTRWLDIVNERNRQSYGTMTFRNCLQIHNQHEGDGPLVEVPPSSRVVLEDCNLVQGSDLADGKLAHIYSIEGGPGELHVIRCDGIASPRLLDHIRLEGPEAMYRFQDCGTLWGASRSLTNFPDEANTPTPLQFSPEEAEALRLLLADRDALTAAIETARRIREGELTTTLPE